MLFVALSSWVVLVVQVEDSPDRFIPISLVELKGDSTPPPQQQQPEGQAPPPLTQKGYDIIVNCCVLGGGRGEVVLTSFAEGETLMGGVRSALAWARLHRSTLLRLFSNRPERVDLRRRDLDYYMDFGLDHLRLTGSSVSKTVFLPG